MKFEKKDFDDCEVSVYTAIQPGIYKISCVRMTECDTKAGNGKYIKGEFDILEGEFKARKLYRNFTWINASEKAQRIGRAQLKEFCFAVGAIDSSGNPTSSEACVNRICQADVVIDPGNTEYGPSAKIKRFEPLHGPTQLSLTPSSSSSDDFPF